MRVLVIDSDPAGRQEICRALDRSGFELLQAGSAAQAGEVLGSQPPDAVVIDTLLCDQSGFAVCRTIRESPETKDVPVLMLSRSSSDMDRILALEAGADDVLTRPFFPRELALRVRSVLRRNGPAPGSARDAEPLEYGPLRLDEQRRSVTAGGSAGRSHDHGVRRARAPDEQARPRLHARRRSWPSSGRAAAAEPCASWTPT